MVAEHVTDVYLAPIEMDGSDEPVFVSTNIEYDKIPDSCRSDLGENPFHGVGKLHVLGTDRVF